MDDIEHSRAHYQTGNQRADNLRQLEAFGDHAEQLCGQQDEGKIEEKMIGHREASFIGICQNYFFAHQLYFFGRKNQELLRNLVVLSKKNGNVLKRRGSLPAITGKIDLGR